MIVPDLVKAIEEGKQKHTMNEQVKKLAVQAGLIAPYGSDHEGLRDFDYRKFAELIVLECIEALDENDGSVHHSECLLEHFGVEE